MKIAIEARGLAGRGGIRTYIQQLLGAIVGQSADVSLEIWHGNKSTMDTFPDATNVLVPIRHEALMPWWLHHTLPQRIAARRPDLVHFTKADVPSRKRVPTVVTIYDVIPLLLPSSQSLLRRAYWPRALERAATQSDHIITISEGSKQGIVERLGVDPKKISVTPLAVDTNHFKPTSSRLPGIPNPYMLFVGQWDTKKNIKALLHAFSHIAPHVPHTLIIAGRAAHKNIDVMAIARGYHIQSRVRLLQDVPYADLPVLYAGADLFVFPSIIEGWGFPPHEAMACGTPVIVSNASPLPEVVGDAGIVVPFSTDDISQRAFDTVFVERLATEMQSVLQDPSKQREMSQRGVRQAAGNTWEGVAQQTLDVYRKVLTI